MVSIIVPVYNAEKYLVECIESLRSQSYKDIEIILVNDGSTDKSGDICKYYTNIDSRIIYMEQENRGEGGARNSGLTMCKGEYVVFCDSDDKLPSDSVEALIGHACEAELVVGGIEKIEHGRLVQHLPPKKQIQGRKMISECIWEESYYMNPAGCKLYRMDIIRENKLLFNDFKYGADTYFVYKYLRYVDRIAFIEKIVYHVNVVENSMSTGIVLNSWSYLSAQYELIRDIVCDFDDIRHGILMNKIKAVLLLEYRISKSSFINNCEIIVRYINKEESFKVYKGSLYDAIIYYLLRRKRYSVLYYIISTRIRFSIGL